MWIDESGWLMGWAGAAHIESPNFDERPGNELPSLIVVHAISLPPDSFGGPHVTELFTNSLDPFEHPYFEGIASLRVSAHFLLRRDGAVIQYVSCAKRAWHAGASSWRGRERVNDYSIGIELEGSDSQPFEEAQYVALSQLAGVVSAHYPIAEMVGHVDVAPGRKTDPGPFFQWARLREMLASR